MNDQFLHASKINKSFIQDSINLEVIKEIDFQFRQSESYSIMGVSGTGKSTLIHILACIEAPTYGNIYFNKLDVNKLAQKEKNEFLNNTIGLVFQEPYLIKELTVLENVILKGLIKKMDYNLCRERAFSLLQKVGLEDKTNQLPSMLSVGQQQRVAILRAIFNMPKFLLADEPTANLDYKTAQGVFDLLLHCQAEWNMGLIITTHDHALASCTQKKLELKNGLLFNFN